MTYRQEAERLISALAGFLEEPGLALDASGTLSLQLEGFQVTFFYESGPEILYMQIPVGSLAEATDSASALERLLEANYLWQGTAGGIIGLNPEDDRLYLSYALSLPLVGEDNAVADDDFLLEFLPHLLGAARAARDVLEPQEAEGGDETAYAIRA